MITQGWLFVTILSFRILALVRIFLQDFEPFLKELKKSEMPNPSCNVLFLFFYFQKRSAHLIQKYITNVRLRLKLELRRSKVRKSSPSQQSEYFNFAMLYMLGFPEVELPKKFVSRMCLSLGPRSKIGLLRMY